MMNIILLAAGNSRRFQGKNKLLAMAGTRPLFLHCFEAWKEAAEAAGDCQIIAVAREKIILDAAKRLGFAAVESPDSVNGISYSIKAGIQEVLKNKSEGLKLEDRLIFSVSDQPFLQKDTLIRFLHTAKTSPYGCVSFQGHIYNPVSFPVEAVPELLSLEGDQGGKKVLRMHLEELTKTEAGSELEIRDVDVIKDLDGL